MNKLELDFFGQQSRNEIVRWYRYVDDVLCLWKGDENQLKSLQQELNSYHNNIEFTTEWNRH